MIRALMCVCMCSLCACSQLYYDLGEPLDQRQLPEQGAQLRLKDVLSKLGPPQRFSAIAGGYVMAWEHWQIKEQTLGVSLGPLGVDLFSIDMGNAQVAGEFLVLNFDSMHNYRGGSFSRWDEQAGSGSALQPSFGVVDVVDVDDLLQAMPQHRWGAISLQPLPRALNAVSSPDGGQGGLEQRGTPVGAGQRTLEWDD